MSSLWWPLAVVELSLPLQHCAGVSQGSRTLGVCACLNRFLEAGTGDVKRDNLKELFAYAIYYKAM